MLLVSSVNVGREREREIAVVPLSLCLTPTGKEVIDGRQLVLWRGWHLLLVSLFSNFEDRQQDREGRGGSP